VPGAADLVHSLRAEYRVALLTDGPVRAQEGKLEALGWTDLFDAVLVTGALPTAKPDRRAFEHLLDAVDAPPAATAYVGDHPDLDVRGAHGAGLHPVQVLYDGGPDLVPEAAATVDRDALAADLRGTLASL
jgi:putative hydrolase of the HAD superfamily